MLSGVLMIPGQCNAGVNIFQDEKRKQLVEEQDEAATKSKRRSLGNIR
jgi:hypothetical protein